MKQQHQPMAEFGILYLIIYIHTYNYIIIYYDYDMIYTYNYIIIYYDYDTWYEQHHIYDSYI